MENSHILCKLALKNFGNVFLLTPVFRSIDKEKRTSEVVKEMQGFMEATPSKLIRKTSYTILKKDLELFLYMVYHKILPRDFKPRIRNSRRWFSVDHPTSKCARTALYHHRHNVKLN
ncbi:hypothetical protein BDFB_014382, partial [Asbolus verrucosus]